MRPLILDSMILPTFFTTLIVVLFIVFSYVVYHGFRLAILLSEITLETVTRAWSWIWDVINEYKW